MELAHTVAKRLAKAVGTVEEAKAEAKEAKEKEKSSGESSLRAIAKEITSINDTSFFEDTFEGDPFQTGKSKEWTPAKVAVEEAARMIAGQPLTGKVDDSTYRVRRSELTLMVDQRDNLMEMIEAYDKYAKEKKKEDKKYSINTRSKVLSGLRKLRKNEDLSPADIIAGEEAPKETSPKDKALKLLERLMETGAFSAKVQGAGVVFDDRALDAYEVLKSIAENGPDVAGTLARESGDKSEGEEKAPPSTSPEQLKASPEPSETDEGEETASLSTSPDPSEDSGDETYFLPRSPDPSDEELQKLVDDMFKED